MKILFVCSGNTCRSPLAVAAWCKLSREGASVTDIYVDSAGAFAASGAPASQHAITVARDWNCDISCHRARQISEEDVKSADMVCAMTRSQADVLRDRFSQCADKITVLGSWQNRDVSQTVSSDEARLQALLDETDLPRHAGSDDIGDPYGGSMEAYRSCAQQIENAVEGLRCAVLRGDWKNVL